MRYDIKVYKRLEGFIYPQEAETIRGLTLPQVVAIESVFVRLNIYHKVIPIHEKESKNG